MSLFHVKWKVFGDKLPYTMHIYYGALHLIVNLTYSFYKYSGACPRAQQAGSAPTKEPQSGEIFVENACRVILGGLVFLDETEI